MSDSLFKNFKKQPNFWYHRLSWLWAKFLTDFFSEKSNLPEVFYKKRVLRNSAKFTRKRMCQSLFFNKVAGLRCASLLKKKLWHRCFLVNFAKFLRTPFFIERLWWLVMSIAPVIANAALHCKHLDPWWNDVLYAWS